MVELVIVKGLRKFCISRGTPNILVVIYIYIYIYVCVFFYVAVNLAFLKSFWLASRCVCVCIYIYIYMCIYIYSDSKRWTQFSASIFPELYKIYERST